MLGFYLSGGILYMEYNTKMSSLTTSLKHNNPPSHPLWCMCKPGLCPAKQFSRLFSFSLAVFFIMACREPCGFARILQVIYNSFARTVDKPFSFSSAKIDLHFSSNDGQILSPSGDRFDFSPFQSRTATTQ